MGDVVGKSVYEWFSDKNNMKLVDKLLAQVKILNPTKESSTKSKKLSGFSFVVTGTLSGMSRDEAKEKIRVLGGDISESVSRNTSYLIVGENPGSKFDKAKELGIEILDEEKFKKLVQ